MASWTDRLLVQANSGPWGMVRSNPMGRSWLAARPSMAANGPMTFALVRYNADGALDATFGKTVGGSLTTVGAGDDVIGALALPKQTARSWAVGSNGQRHPGERFLWWRATTATVAPRRHLWPRWLLRSPTLTGNDDFLRLSVAIQERTAQIIAVGVAYNGSKWLRCPPLCPL